MFEHTYQLRQKCVYFTQNCSKMNDPRFGGYITVVHHQRVIGLSVEQGLSAYLIADKLLLSPENVEGLTIPILKVLRFGSVQIEPRSDCVNAIAFLNYS
jgi:hypothetical protein